jgi:glycosyltransferase involved in cell wall biosynthesis
MRVVHVTAYFAPAFRYGGPPRSILGLCRALDGAGLDVEVFTTTANGETPLPAAPDGVMCEGVRARYFPLAWPQRSWRAAGLASALAESIQSADLVHVHGLWNATAWTGMRIARAAHVPYAISPRGMLQPDAIARHRLAKQVVDRAFQHRFVQDASFLHATSDAEARALTAIGPRVALIPNGVEARVASPAEIERMRSTLELPPAGDETPIVSVIGRLHPIKRLDLVAAAFDRLGGNGHRPVLVVAGPDEGGHRWTIEPLFGESVDVRWTGPLDNDTKWALLGASRALIQCSDSESFGLSVAEAMSAGVPVVVTDRGAWNEVARVGCGYVTAHDPAAIANALRCLFDAPERARAMGKRGQAWMRERFGWDAIGRAMTDEYERACQASS